MNAPVHSARREKPDFHKLSFAKANELCVLGGQCTRLDVLADVRSAKDRPKEAEIVQRHSTQAGNPDKRKAFCKQLGEPRGKIYSHSALFSYLQVWATAETFKK